MTEQLKQKPTSKIRKFGAFLGALIGSKDTDYDRAITEIPFMDHTDDTEILGLSRSEARLRLTATADHKSHNTDVRMVNADGAESTTMPAKITDEEFVGQYLTNVEHLSPDDERWAGKFAEGVESIRKLNEEQATHGTDSTEPKVQ